MPPRYAYWTILIDQKATAFRARDQAELLPTVHQLRRTNKDVVLRWFARGRLWESPEQEAWATTNMRRSGAGARGRDWRPGGDHRDPKARFEKGSFQKPAGSGGRQHAGSNPKRSPAAPRPHRPPRRRRS